MEIETRGLGAGSYPEPTIYGKETQITLNVELTIKNFYPKDMTRKDIEEDIRHNIRGYIDMGEIDDWEVEIN